MTAKLLALASLAVISLIIPALEVFFMRRVDLFGSFGIAETLLASAAVYWWYYLDKRERHYHTGPIMNIAVVALAIFALPVYFVRSRGWKAGSIATGVAIAVFGISLALGMLGESIGRAVSP